MHSVYLRWNQRKLVEIQKEDVIIAGNSVPTCLRKKSVSPSFVYLFVQVWVSMSWHKIIHPSHLINKWIEQRTCLHFSRYHGITTSSVSGFVRLRAAAPFASTSKVPMAIWMHGHPRRAAHWSRSVQRKRPVCWRLGPRSWCWNWRAPKS